MSDAIAAPLFRGVLTALVTPFRNGEVDYDAFRAQVERQIAAGVHGLVPVGTTGETSTLSMEEHKAIVKLCVETAAGRVRVIAGAGSNNTAETLELARHAKAVGADAVLVVVPYYNKPSQEGLYQHFKALNDSVQIPVLLYNVPGRTVVDMSNDTIARLSKLPNIVGVKDATGALDRMSQLRVEIEPGRYTDPLVADGDIELVAVDGPSTVVIAPGRAAAIETRGDVRLTDLDLVTRADTVRCRSGTLTVEGTRIRSHEGAGVFAVASGSSRASLPLAGLVGLKDPARRRATGSWSGQG